MTVNLLDSPPLAPHAHVASKAFSSPLIHISVLPAPRSQQVNIANPESSMESTKGIIVWDGCIVLWEGYIKNI